MFKDQLIIFDEADYRSQKMYCKIPVCSKGFLVPPSFPGSFSSRHLEKREDHGNEAVFGAYILEGERLGWCGCV